MAPFFKLSIVFRNYGALYDYKKSSEEDFFSRVHAAIAALSSDTDVAYEDRGETGRVWYYRPGLIPDKESIRDAVKGILGDADACAVAVSQVDTDELRRLVERRPGNIADKPWFSLLEELAAQLPPADPIAAPDAGSLAAMVAEYRKMVRGFTKNAASETADGANGQEPPADGDAPAESADAKPERPAAKKESPAKKKAAESEAPVSEKPKAKKKPATKKTSAPEEAPADPPKESTGSLAAMMAEYRKMAQGLGKGAAAEDTETDERTEETNKPAPKKKPSQSKRAKEKEAEPETGPAAPEEQPAPVTLAEEAGKLDELRAALLSRVRGQRHAVEEVVQAIFECDMFSSRNESRKGPLVSFLFVGPSGVGKTYLASLCGELLGREMLTVDMSEYSDNLSHGKFNGDFGEQAIVTGFVRAHPNGILLFDEIEKAHINTIHLFLQILDAGRLTDMRCKKEVSFRDTVIILTTNAGKQLYEDTACDLSGVSRNTVLEALRSDTDPATHRTFFPECITTRFANGHVVLFNHLEPYALTEIVRDEIRLQLDLFYRSTGIRAECNEDRLAAMVLYHAGGVADARTLRGTVKNILVRELQQIVMQTWHRAAADTDLLKTVRILVDPAGADERAGALFAPAHDTLVPVFADDLVGDPLQKLSLPGTVLSCTADTDTFKKRVRSLADYVLIDPFCGMTPTERMPNDIEDLPSEGMEMFRYMQEYCPETPVYFLDTRKSGEGAFRTLLSLGGRGVVDVSDRDPAETETAFSHLAFSAQINNNAYALARSGQILTYNCSQYTLDDTTAEIVFRHLACKLAPSAADTEKLVRADASGIRLSDVVGCDSAKEALTDFCRFVRDPRKAMLSGERIPRGVLLYGPPGTGKTMLARAIANEAGVPFFQTTATALFGSLVGESERNVQALFRRARKYAPSIIFIDEIDAIGRMRTGSSNSRHNEDVLTAFLAEMDGFATDVRRPVFLIAATNYEIEGSGGRVLDPAFVRRFDKRVLLRLPDKEGRRDLLRLKLRHRAVTLDGEMEAAIEKVAERSGGMSGADLELIVESFLKNCGEGALTGKAMMEALDTYRFGETNKIAPETLRQTACHEAGHALLYRLCGTTPSFLTVVSRGHFGGFMEFAPDEEKTGYTYGELLDRACCALGGRAAEITEYGDGAGCNTGASSDVRMARDTVYAAITTYAMGERLFPDEEKDAAEAERVLRAQYDRALSLLAEHRDTLRKLTDLLARERNLDRTQLDAFFTEAGV